MEISKFFGSLAGRMPDKALEFYKNILGLRFIREDDFALVFDSKGAIIRI